MNHIGLIEIAESIMYFGFAVLIVAGFAVVVLGPWKREKIRKAENAQAKKFSRPRS